MKTYFLTLLLVLLTGCSHSGVEVQNHTKSQITNIEIRVAGNALSIDQIAPGGSRRVSYYTKNEDAIAISFLIEGRQKNCAEKIYVSPPFEDEFTIRILPTGKCSISVREVR
jgi:hypothetical protein